MKFVCNDRRGAGVLSVTRKKSGIAGWFGHTETVSSKCRVCGGIGEWDKDVFDPITLRWEGPIPHGDYGAKRPEAEALAAKYLCQLVESPSNGGAGQVPLEQAKKVVANGLLRYRGRRKKNDPSYDLKCDGREIWWREYHVVASMNDDSEHVTYDFRVSRTGPNTYQVSQKFS